MNLVPNNIIDLIDKLSEASFDQGLDSMYATFDERKKMNDYVEKCRQELIDAINELFVDNP